MADRVNVLCIWDVPDRLRNYLQDGLDDVPNIDLIFPDPADEENYLRHAPDADIIIGWRPTRELLDSASVLRLFINPGAGVAHHIEPFRELNKTRKVLLANGHGNTYFTAQHVVALLLALTNKIIPHHNWMAEGRWRTGEKEGRSIPVRDRRIGFLGYGAVNSKVHRMLSGFAVEFSILKRQWNDETIEFPTDVNRFTTNELHPFLEEIDTLIIAIPQTSVTTGLIGKTELELLGSEGLLVNIGRGPIVDEKNLYEALKNGTIMGAAIDVWYNYRPEEDEDGRKYPCTYPFHELDNVVLSPHRGASPMNDLKRWDEVIENIRRMAEGAGEYLNIVDLDREY